MDRLGKYLIVALFFITGCPAEPNSDFKDFTVIHDMSGVDPGDGSTTEPDFYTPPQDLRGFPDGTVAVVTVNYHLINSLLQGQINQGWPIYCGQGADGGLVDPAVLQVKLSVTNGTDTNSRTVNCNLGSNFGQVDLPLPALPPGGEWTFSGSAVGHADSNCDVACTDVVGAQVSVYIYADGCDNGHLCQAICNACPCP
jgi:hypothetical protein